MRLPGARVFVTSRGRASSRLGRTVQSIADTVGRRGSRLPGCSRDLEMPDGDLDVAYQHRVEERVEPLRYVPGHVPLGAGRALLHRHPQDDRHPTGSLDQLRLRDSNPLALVTSPHGVIDAVGNPVDDRSGSGSWTVTTRSSWFTSSTINDDLKRSCQSWL